MVTTKKIVKEYTQKEMRRKLICFTTKKNQLNTKEEVWEVRDKKV